MIPPPEGLSFHHIGVASENLERDASAFAAVGYAQESEPFADAGQGIRGLFLTGPGPRLELVTPYDAGSTVLAGLIAQRIKLYHLAFEADDLDAALAALKAQRGKVVVPPSPAVAFGGRLICFVALPNRVLVELIAT